LLTYFDDVSQVVVKEWNSIKLLVYDFDGVMTDNKVYIDQHGHEMVQVSRADGLGIAEIRKLGIQQMILSTEANPVVSARAEKLDLLCLQGVDNKAKALTEYCNVHQISLSDVAYVGNDINDLEVMKLVGTTFCPADAHSSIKEITQYILGSKGGEGVSREIFDLLT
jgi:3-deoxy-D-manno-octulosonate 8-phosphate phosphatase (KDO 8-P phosphatase)